LSFAENYNLDILDEPADLITEESVDQSHVPVHPISPVVKIVNHYEVLLSDFSLFF